jgi:RNA polymerase sigma-70 factor (ECF subfamily)
MMFSCCHPRLPEPAQVALVLNILCGFGKAEIAGAFLCNEAAIEKRITRGKKVLAGSKTLFDPATASDFGARLLAVQRALYLLFNEGYHGASDSAVRVELCDEAMRLVRVLLEHPPAATPRTFALAALMCFHAARLPARLNGAGDLIPLLDQDRSRWDETLVAEGRRLLDLSATGPELSEYHVEAAIGAVHADARNAEATRWDRIVSLYDTLLSIRPSPVVALQRALAVAQLRGADCGLEEVRAVEGSERLARYPFYHAALGELELRRGNGAVAGGHFRAALSVARNGMERRFLTARISVCDHATP